MDPLSQILSLLKPRSSMCGGIDAGGDWSIAYPADPSIKCYAIVSGRCWLVVDGAAQAVRVETGDCFLLPLGLGFRLTSDPAVEPVDIKAIITAPLQGAVTIYNGGGACFGVGGVFQFDGDHADMLLSLLPPVVHIRRESDRAELRWALDRMMHELREARPGGALVAEYLASMILVQALRLHLAEGQRGGIGWLFALADKEMSAAIHLMHGDPARRWTLADLAERVGLSRSSFAQRFKETVGTSPMEYLTRWRMLLASERLTNSGDPISAVALQLGYESESAFSAAFKRIMHCSPRQYTRRRTSAASGALNRAITTEPIAS